MAESNPYAAPVAESEQPPPKLPGARTLFASIAAVALTTFGGCGVGMGAGYFGGLVAPSYYASADLGYAAIPTAIVIGMGQGLGGGCATGVALVALFYWYRSRVNRKFVSKRT